MPILGQADPKDCKQRPNPEVAEGLISTEVPYWIRKRLGGYCNPRAYIAFPNFVVELKGDGSMFVAHVQSRLAGAVASQAFVECLDQIQGNAKSAGETSLVGSIKFNGEVIMGNIQCVSSSNGSLTNRKARKYHITRVMSRTTHGLGYEDFIAACKEARNFRDYFRVKQEKFLEDCNGLSEPKEQLSSRSRMRQQTTGEDEEDEDDDEDETGDQQHKSPPPRRPPPQPKADRPVNQRGGKKRGRNQTKVDRGGRKSKKPKRGAVITNNE